MQVWNQVEQRLTYLCARNSHYQKFLARAKYFGRTVTIDRQGRMLIPISLRRSAQIKGVVDVIDYSGYLEVWNHARFLRNLRSDPITPQDEDILNQQVSSIVRFPRAARSRKPSNKYIEKRMVWAYTAGHASVHTVG
jgi:DNA-binding transcriptional regulator/RsmH inhibitor MraZ